MIDATNWYQPGAIGNYDNTTGDKIGAQALINYKKYDNGGEREPYGSKAGGMGDVEFLCDPAPIEIGNLAWVDINQNGIQDAVEPPYPNVPVNLECKENGNYVAYGTVNTDSKGHYYFGGINNTNLANGKQLVSGLECRLSIAKSDVNNKPATTQNPNNDANDTIDNDAAEVGDYNVIEFTLSNTNNHNLDFGIEPTMGCITGNIFQDNDDNTIDVNTVESNGATRVTVGGNNSKALVLTLDAGVNCNCSDVSNDFASALNIVSILFIVLFSSLLGFSANRREKK